jgi:apolipoprotein N-acyltransferase
LRFIPHNFHIIPPSVLKTRVGKYGQVYELEVNMKDRKWLRWTLGIALALVVVAGAGFAGFQLGAAQNASFDGMMPFAHWRAFEMVRGFRGHDFGMIGFGRGGFLFFPPIFGLIRLAVFAGLIWLGYALIKRSSWRFVNVNSNQADPQSPTATDAKGKKEEA